MLDFVFLPRHHNISRCIRNVMDVPIRHVFSVAFFRFEVESGHQKPRFLPISRPIFFIGFTFTVKGFGPDESPLVEWRME